MEIKQLYYFVETCRMMSFSEAAKALYLTPQALSKSIHNLESELGGEVFFRTGNTITLTDYGHLLLQRSQNLLKSYDLLVGDMKYASHHFSGKLTVGFGYDVLRSLPPDTITAFMDRYPDLLLDLEEMPDEVLEERMLNGSLDFAFIAGLPLQRTHFDFRLACSSPLGAVLLRSNPLFQQGYFTFEDLRTQKFIQYAHNARLYQRVFDHCQQMGFTPEYLIRSTHLELNKRVLWSKGGVSLGAYNIWKDYPYSDAVGSIPMVGNDDFRWEVYLMLPKDRQLTPGARLLAEYLYEQLALLDG